MGMKESYKRKKGPERRIKKKVNKNVQLNKKSENRENDWKIN